MFHADFTHVSAPMRDIVCVGFLESMVKARDPVIDWLRQNWFFIFVACMVVIMHTEYGRGGIGPRRPAARGPRDHDQHADHDVQGADELDRHPNNRADARGSQED
jgi:hypothetical protein